MTKLNRESEVHLKLDRIRAWLAEQHCPGLLLRQRSNFAWLTAGGRSHVNAARDTGAAAILVTPESVVVLANNIEAQRLAEEELIGVPVEFGEYAWSDVEGENRLLADLVSEPAELARDTEPVVGLAMAALRARLLNSEIIRFEALGQLTSGLVEEVCWSLEPGVSEHQVAAQVHAAALPHGALVPVCLVAGDDRIARRRHPLATDRPIQEQAMVAVCIERGGLVCSVTRLVSFVPLSDDLRRKHEAVCGVEAAAVVGTRVGRPLRHVFTDIVDAYARAGFPDEWRHHHQGGSTGYQPRDVIATPILDTVVQADQAFAWNPSIVGTKGEDTMLATEEGFRWITGPGAGWPIREVEAHDQKLTLPDILVRTG